jgi:hypothetical protein
METTATPRFKGCNNADDLKMYNGTENYYKCLTILYTDGIKHLCESRQCYWLITDIALYTSYVMELKKEPFLTCELIKTSEKNTLIYTDGNNNILFSQDIEYTDFADEGVCLYLIEGVLMLPSEY